MAAESSVTRTLKIVTGILALFALLALAGGALLLHFYRSGPITLVGAVMEQSANPREQSPIAGVEVSANGLAAHATRSGFSGLFRLTLRPMAKLGQAITLRFTHAGYKPLVMHTLAGNQIYTARMVPLHPEPKARHVHPNAIVSDVLVRYSEQTTTTASVGTTAKTLLVESTANVPCKHGSVCSPDGRWKADMRSTSIDAEKGNVFEDPRVSCIAGPCPFTRIDFEGLSQGGRVFTVTARTWAGTATFLLQAEVVHPEVDNAVQSSYPYIFGREMNFSLPAKAEGASLEAKLNGIRIIFPLPPGSDPDLSWTDCMVSAGEKKTRLYRCRLKPGYKFR